MSKVMESISNCTKGMVELGFTKEQVLQILSLSVLIASNLVLGELSRKELDEIYSELRKESE